VAAAAAALGWVGHSCNDGKAMIEASKAVPALLRVIERSVPPGDPEDETDLFRRYVHDFSRTCLTVYRRGSDLCFCDGIFGYKERM
jgi:hypothetical protein